MSTINEVCNFFGVTRQTVHAWQKRGVVRKPPRGAYDIQVIAQAIVADWIALKAGHGDHSSAATLSAARTDLAREQAEAMRIKNMYSRGELVSLAGVQHAIEGTCTNVRELILAVPGKQAAHLEMRSRAEIEEMLRDELYELLETLSDPTKTLPPEYRAALAHDRSDDDDQVEDDAAE
jgi:phage terminase Nu1 subunit (DNA packaging protein)